MATQLVQRKWGKDMHTSNREDKKEHAQYVGEATSSSCSWRWRARQSGMRRRGRTYQKSQD